MRDILFCALLNAVLRLFVALRRVACVKNAWPTHARVRARTRLCVVCERRAGLFKPELGTGLGVGGLLESRLGAVIEAVEARTVDHDRTEGG